MIPPPNVLLPKAYWEWARRKPVDGRYSPEGPITLLKPNEVFVFGSNLQGFHGAGSAGFAYTGKPGNQYRLGNPMLQAPNGHKGHWAVLGVAVGFQEGQHGRSYAICTIIRPGQKRSMPLTEIRRQVAALYQFAENHPELTFLVPQSGTLNKPSFNGYFLNENASCYLTPLENPLIQ